MGEEETEEGHHEGKRLEIIKEALPNVRRVAVLLNPTNAYQVRDEKEIQAAASVLNVTAKSYWVSRVDTLENALAEIRESPPDALFVPADRLCSGFLARKGFSTAGDRPG